MKTSIESVVKFSVILLIGLCDITSGADWYTASDGRKYLIEKSQSYNWQWASIMCARSGLQLAVIDSSAKNSALVSLLRTIFAKSPNLWIGHHDGFNTNKDMSRNWYAASTGIKVSFSYWGSENPNNEGGNENCAQFYEMTDFKWNDLPCTRSIGYICEEHYKTTEFRSLMNTKRTSTLQKNNQLSSDFVMTNSNIGNIMKNIRNETEPLFELWQSSSDSIWQGFRKSLDELLAKKPYLQAVIADVGSILRASISQTQEELTNLSKHIQQSIGEVQTNADIAVDNEILKHTAKIQENINQIDSILVY